MSQSLARSWTTSLRDICCSNSPKSLFLISAITFIYRCICRVMATHFLQSRESPWSCSGRGKRPARWPREARAHAQLLRRHHAIRRGRGTALLSPRGAGPAVEPELRRHRLAEMTNTGHITHGVARELGGPCFIFHGFAHCAGSISTSINNTRQSRRRTCDVPSLERKQMFVRIKVFTYMVDWKWITTTTVHDKVIKYLLP